MLKPIPNFPDYFADKQGNIWSRKIRGPSTSRRLSKPRKIRLNNCQGGGGYPSVNLYKNKKPHHRRIHCLILETFVGPCPEGYWARHLDGNGTNNHKSNLKWDTPSSNIRDKIKHGTMPSQIGEKNHAAKLNNIQVRVIKWLLENTDMHPTEIGQFFSVSRQLIGKIKNKRIWTHV